MSVAVLGMDMPNNCCDCPLFKSNASGYLFCKGKRISFGKEDAEWLPKETPNWCPLRPLPDHHGRLIDADVLELGMQELWESNEISNGDWLWFREELYYQETILEAEGE